MALVMYPDPRWRARLNKVGSGSLQAGLMSPLLANILSPQRGLFGASGHGSSILMEVSGYVLMEDGSSHILMES